MKAGVLQRLGPLRKIVSRGHSEHGVPTETLECGHTIHEKQDIIGPTNADRRRCRYCRDNVAPPPPPPKTDGLGQALIPDADYYVQDSRTLCGNCISWWRPKGADYCCDLNEAGVYKGSDVIGMRGTDVPWPVEHVRARTVTHVRGDTQAFHRTHYKPGPRE